MKKSIFTFLSVGLILGAGGAAMADSTLKIHYNNGQTTTVPAADIDYVEFTLDDTPSQPDVNPNPGNEWKSLGMIEYTDAFICAMYFTYEYGGCDPYWVEIQENTTQPGYYRLVNPYGPAYPLSSQMSYYSDEETYLYINATNPQRVTIPYSPQTIMPDASYGPITCLSLTEFFIENYTPEEIYEYGYYGTLNDGVLTFNPRALGIEDAEGTYYANVIALQDGSFLTEGDNYVAPFYLDFNSINSGTRSNIDVTPATKIADKFIKIGKTVSAKPQTLR